MCLRREMVSHQIVLNLYSLITLGSMKHRVNTRVPKLIDLYMYYAALKSRRVHAIARLVTETNAFNIRLSWT